MRYTGAARDSASTEDVALALAHQHFSTADGAVSCRHVSGRARVARRAAHIRYPRTGGLPSWRGSFRCLRGAPDCLLAWADELHPSSDWVLWRWECVTRRARASGISYCCGRVWWRPLLCVRCAVVSLQAGRRGRDPHLPPTWPLMSKETCESRRHGWKSHQEHFNVSSTLSPSGTRSAALGPPGGQELENPNPANGRSNL